MPQPDFPFSLTRSVLRGNINQVNPIRLGGVVSFGLTPQPSPDFPTDIGLGLAWDIGPLNGSTPVLSPTPTPDRGADNSFFDVFFISRWAMDR